MDDAVREYDEALKSYTMKEYPTAVEHAERVKDMYARLNNTEGVVEEENLILNALPSCN
ncbi:MAG: hypothetical protein ABIH11_05135 [Candidatus Altiarchaeota archaeon]